LSALEKKVGISSLDDWYQVSAKDVLTNGGYLVLGHSHSRHKLAKSLQSEYPYHKWEVTRFVHWQQGQLQSADVQRECLLWIGKQLGVVKLDDWYSISTNKVDAVAGALPRAMYATGAVH
jgi:hypothetical protein